MLTVGSCATLRIDMGTCDELALDTLLNSLVGFSRDVAALAGVRVGGVNEGWPVPDTPDEADSDLMVGTGPASMLGWADRLWLKGAAFLHLQLFTAAKLIVATAHVCCRPLHCHTQRLCKFASPPARIINVLCSCCCSLTSIPCAFQKGLRTNWSY